MKVKRRLQKKILAPSIEKTINQPSINSLQNYQGFCVEDFVWFKSSLVLEKFSFGRIKSISKNDNGNIAFMVWDESNNMWRMLGVESLLKEQPKKVRKKRKKNLENEEIDS